MPRMKVSAKQREELIRKVAADIKSELAKAAPQPSPAPKPSGGGKRMFVKALSFNEPEGIVYGWAMVSKKDGKMFVDSQGDHIPEDALRKAAIGFMESDDVRITAHEHAKDKDGKPIPDGKVVFGYPLTAEIKKKLGITSRLTGMIVGVKPNNPEVFQNLMKNGGGFSIGGFATSREPEWMSAGEIDFGDDF